LSKRYTVSVNNVAIIFFIVLLVYTQLTTYENFWPAKSRWRDAVMEAATSRTATQPGLISIAPQSPVAYYDRRYSLVQGISIDVGWQRFLPDEIRDIAAYLDNNDVVWAILPMQDPQSWDALVRLYQGRGVRYRDSVQGTIFYRFDTGSNESLDFSFDNRISVNWDYHAYAAGETICPADVVTELQAIHSEFTLIRGYNEVIAIVRDACLSMPETDIAGHIRFAIIDENGKPLPLVEQGLYWGDYLYVGAVSEN
jgi:hypothetical protein